MHQQRGAFRAFFVIASDHVSVSHVITAKPLLTRSAVTGSRLDGMCSHPARRNFSAWREPLVMQASLPKEKVSSLRDRFSTGALLGLGGQSVVASGVADQQASLA